MEGDKPCTIDAASAIAELQKIKDEDEFTVEDDVTKENERRWVDTLLSCSGEQEEEFGYISKIVCNDWNQAVHGWEDTRPNVKYAWGASSGSSKKRETNDGPSRKTKAQRQHVIEEENSWRRCVEPTTFRYMYDPKGLHRTTLKFYNGITIERALEEEGFSDHILKLREYLEKTLTTAKKETSQGIKEHAQLGQFYESKKSPRKKKERRSSRKKASGKVRGLGDGLYIQSDVSEPEDESDTKATFGRIEGKGLDDSMKPLINDRRDTPILPVRKVEKQNIGQLNKHQIPSDSPKLKLSHSPPNKISQSPVNSYERFPAQSVTPNEPSLNPLKKVTPHQRQIYDDNQVLGYTMVSSGLGKPSSAKSEPEHTPAYKVVMEHHSAPHKSNRMDRNAFVQVNGKAMSAPQPFKQFPLTQELATVSKLLRDQDQKNKNKSKRVNKSQPFKHGLGQSSSAGDPGVTGKLGDPLHRGVMDRETAGAMASELLPGVSGNKLHLPIYSQRIL